MSEHNKCTHQQRVIPMITGKPNSTDNWFHLSYLTSFLYNHASFIFLTSILGVNYWLILADKTQVMNLNSGLESCLKRFLPLILALASNKSVQTDSHSTIIYKVHFKFSPTIRLLRFQKRFFFLTQDFRKDENLLSIFYYQLKGQYEIWTDILMFSMAMPR